MNHLSEFGTFSKSPAMWGLPLETHVTEAKGAYLKLNDDKWYLDWCAGLGSNLLGYCQPDYVKHVRKALTTLGGSLTLPSYLETQTAEKLCHLLGSHVPDWTPEVISARFAKTGSDATMMAIRLARAVTNRPYIITFKGHYHGWGADFISRSDPAYGILPIGGNSYERQTWQGVRELDWDDFNIGSYYRYDEIAAIIFEQGITDPPPGWYDYLRDLCNQTGALLVVDEVVTGLRYGLGGASERYGIKPDLMCVGKALGNGLPIAALVGRREYLDWFSRIDPVFASSTFWGESVGLAAADYVLDNWAAEDVDYLWRMGNELINRSAWPIIGHGARSLFTFQSDIERGWFIRAMKERGILANRPNFPTRSHTATDIENTVTALSEVRQEAEKLGYSGMSDLISEAPKVLFKGR